MKTESNFIDKIVSYFSPEAGLRRSRARFAQQTLRGYDGARPSRSSTWGTQAGINTELNRDLNILRDRSRELVQNNPYAARVLDILTAHIVGDGIVANSSNGNRTDEIIDRLWRDWAETTKCDADGLQNFYGLQAMVCRSVKESGEAIIRLRRRDPKNFNGEIPFQIQVLDPDFLALEKNDEAGVLKGSYIVNGIEFNSRGQRVAYHIYKSHPKENYSTSGLDTIRIPAGEILHVFQPLRPGQTRGVPVFHSVIKALKDLGDYNDAVLLKAKIEACFAAFITSADSDISTGTREVDEYGNKVDTMSPGTITRLNPGEEISAISPTGNGSHEALARNLLQAISVGVGCTYDQLSGDLTGANYSSLRAGKIDFRRQISQFQWNVMITMFVEPVFMEFVKMASIAGKVSIENPKATFMPPAHEKIDPLKDVNAEIVEMESGIRTWSQIVQSRGYDPKKQIEALRKEREEVDAVLPKKDGGNMNNDANGDNNV